MARSHADDPDAEPALLGAAGRDLGLAVAEPEVKATLNHVPRDVVDVVHVKLARRTPAPFLDRQRLAAPHFEGNVVERVGR